MGSRPAWQTLDDEALERLLVERWLRRGLVLGVVLAAAVALTWLGARGLTGVMEHVAAGLLGALALGAAVAALRMRQRDLQIQRELRRRRARPAGPGA